MQVWTRRPATYNGVACDFGQVFTLRGGPRNEQLLRLGYLQEWTKDTVACGECGAKFIGAAERQGHGQKRHKPHQKRVRDLDDLSHHELARLQDKTGMFTVGDQLTASDPDLDSMEREEKVLEERAPLFLENTAASRK